LQSFKSLADKLGVPTGVVGEKVKGVVICEANRVSEAVPSTNIPHIKELIKDKHTDYRRNNIPAVVFGLHQPDGSVEYALYAGVN
jgi:hypothetical protein